ncbi:interferon alpha-inducible protein 27, mitochondrial-like [Heliangelus exortis]|uniref:interferon alpha-inducible protein 27, mitochondrial-like n=1 Tax=Heliangelus exortis TaxID=472823 RepID=UPI003A95672D
MPLERQCVPGAGKKEPDQLATGFGPLQPAAAAHELRHPLRPACPGLLPGGWLRPAPVLRNQVHIGSPFSRSCSPSQHTMEVVTTAAIAATAGAGLAFGIPAVVSFMGFTEGGILAGSLAAKMMSATAIANGGAVPAGSIVALLQSIGAAGLSTGANAALASLGTLGAAASSLFW